MVNQIHSLHITKEDEHYKLTATLKSDDGNYLTLNSKIRQPFLQIETSQDRVNDIRQNRFFKHIVAHNSASFHFNADALVDNGLLFNLTLGKKEKTYIPKKHRKQNRRKTTSK